MFPVDHNDVNISKGYWLNFIVPLLNNIKPRVINQQNQLSSVGLPCKGNLVSHAHLPRPQLQLKLARTTHPASTNMFHVNVSDDRGDARTHGSTKGLLVKRVFAKKDSRIQADF